MLIYLQYMLYSLLVFLAISHTWVTFSSLKSPKKQQTYWFYFNLPQGLMCHRHSLNSSLVVFICWILVLTETQTPQRLEEKL